VPAVREIVDWAMLIIGVLAFFVRGMWGAS
jgi:hypothetical protein